MGIPGRSENGDLSKSPKVDERIDDELRQTFQQIKRGDLGIPSHALKAGAFQYAKQCVELNSRRSYQFCRTQQLDFDKCAFEQGYDKAMDAVEMNAKVKTDRPMPKNPYHLIHQG